MPKAKPEMKKDTKTPNISAATEVDKAFYELKIGDLNRRLARIRALNEELENKNEELETRYKTLNEDRDDVISYLKRIMNDKVDENKELHKRILQLEEAHVQDDLHCKTIIKETKDEYKLLHEQLTSEIKMLNGKLNALDEFRQQKEELMKKFIEQEQILIEQEIRHKREMYDSERKFVIGKDRQKRDMEARLVQLSSDFQNVTEIRIAATTNRVIRENIAINTELNTMLNTHQRLYDENKKLKENNTILKLEAELHNKEKKKAISKSSTQSKLITKITYEYENLKEKLNKYKNMEALSIKLRTELESLLNGKKNLQRHIRLLEQNLHASRCQRGALQTELDYCKDELRRLTSILYESLMSIKVDLMKKPKPTPTKKIVKAPNRETLINNLITLLSKANEEKPLHASLESVESVSVLYSQGDLGLVPRPVMLRSKLPTRRNKEVLMGPSFEEFLANYVPPIINELPVVEEEDEMEEEKVPSVAPIDEFFIPADVSVSSETEIQVFAESSELEQTSSSTTSSATEPLPQEQEPETSEAEQLMEVEGDEAITECSEPLPQESESEEAILEAIEGTAETKSEIDELNESVTGEESVVGD
ncbi:hypothetical protein RI129_000677 [Pyrocoelia pectoralis]|uniref:Cilia- and flagella-associated protein 157 n=1 Tax=Pyrocoelia pectoralis TaxID=417401 RepID=A0AAN7VUS4_9COLE